MLSLIAPVADTTSRPPPKSAQSWTATRCIAGPEPGAPLPIFTSVVGAPSIVT